MRKCFCGGELNIYTNVWSVVTICKKCNDKQVYKGRLRTAILTSLKTEKRGKKLYAEKQGDTCTGCIHLDTDFMFCEYYSDTLAEIKGVFYRCNKCKNISNYRKKGTASETNSEYIDFDLSGGRKTKKGGFCL